MRKLMKCGIILAWGEYTLICSIRACVVFVCCEWVEGDQNLTSQKLCLCFFFFVCM